MGNGKLELAVPQSSIANLASAKVLQIATRFPFWELATGATGATGATEVVSQTPSNDLPSTRAGGQDDGSLNKLPQIIPAGS